MTIYCPVLLSMGIPVAVMWGNKRGKVEKRRKM
jgi:hypothetical protein